MRLSDYHYSYTILISKFLNYFEVNLDEKVEVVQNQTFELQDGKED